MHAQDAPLAVAIINAIRHGLATGPHHEGWLLTQNSADILNTGVPQQSFLIIRMDITLDILTHGLGIIHFQKSIHGYRSTVMVITLQIKDVSIQVHSPQSVIILAQSVYCFLQSLGLLAQFLYIRAQLL